MSERLNDSELIIADAIGTAKNRIESHKNTSVSISGGSDSDIVLDIVSKQDNKNIFFVYFNTGLEYQATRDHIKFLEKKYGITIITERPKMSIPLCVKKYGQPFISKRASEMISRLQKHSFKWEDKPFEELYKEYPHCKSALKWWCNCYDSHTLNINNNKFLKEFLIDNPPEFQISNLCCHFAKKVVVADFNKMHNIDLNINGIRKSEGGIRSVRYTSCFSEAKDKDEGYDTYRPIFWFNNKTKRVYEKENNIIHSECYRVYGLERTGCAGCPFGKDFEKELRILEKYEPKLYKAAVNIFRDSYNYTRMYKEYVKLKKNNGNVQLTLF